MSTKAEKPTLQGQRIKTRKRDEKAKYDPLGFRDAVLQGLNETDSDLEAVNKYLDAAGGKLNYRTYGETLFDILIAGGVLTPGGAISDEGGDDKPISTKVCVFGAPDDSLETLRAYANVFTKLMRRYKYLEKMFQEEMKKVLVYLRGFTAEDRMRLARCVALWLNESLMQPQVLSTLLQEHLVKDGLATDFLCEVLVTVRTTKDIGAVRILLRKSGMDSRLMELLPVNKRNEENFKNMFVERGLAEIINLQRNLEKEGNIKELQIYLQQQMEDSSAVKDIVVGIKEIAKKHNLQEQQIVGICWSAVMGSVEWNKKDDLVAEQAVRHLRTYTPLFAAYTSNDRSELSLVLRIQEFCYDNMNFMRVFQKIIFLFYKSDVLSEEVIMHWYKEGHSIKGRSVFLDQMKKFIEWLQSAEEESDESGEEEED